QACLRPRDRFWDIPVPKIDSAFDNLLVPQPSWSPSTTQQLRKLVAAPYLSPNDWTPRSEAYFASPLALCARRVSSAASRLLGSTSLRFALHGWQRQIARWTNADIVIYVGCGERGNELVDILDYFPELTDPYSGRSLMERTLLVANTSNMPVVAREASIYLGVTLAEYYRDQGHDVVMLADSTSRWAEALREVARRLGQMPVEEGYPAYLASRLASFYERVGRVETLSGESGSVSLIGAVSPPGGNFSEPVTNHTKDIIQTFWALSKLLADARHYPSVSWTESFSDAVEAAARWWSENVDESWQEKRSLALNLLSRAEELARIINLVGAEALSPIQRWTVEMASLLREGLLQQNALDEVDSYCSPQKQFALLDLMIGLYQQGQALVKAGVPVSALLALPLLSRARRSKNLYGNDQLDELHALGEEFRSQLEKLRQEYEE
ncbi:V-type ATP synthase subunit A, partial [Thiolapillus sp.]|uniref:V-type ATP synthase subunit A n=7 Tax=Thiolapillus sp. TaxID=2017437 RepID=UPI003AF890FF